MLKAKTGSNAVYYTRGFELISKREGSSASYYLYDGGLSVRALTSESGSVTDILVFDAFGNETAKTGSTDNSYGFQGEEKDETGLYYLRARYMDPATGTFTSMDTFGGSLTDPMSLHKYLFANSNPVAYCDPSGHTTKENVMTATTILCILALPTLSMLAIVNNSSTAYSNQVNSLFNRLIEKIKYAMIMLAIPYIFAYAIIIYVYQSLNPAYTADEKPDVDTDIDSEDEDWDKWDAEYDEYTSSTPKTVRITPPGNPRNMKRRNTDAEKQWKEALKEAARKLGYPISKAIQDRVHKEIHNNDLDIDDIVERILSYYGR